MKENNVEKIVEDIDGVDDQIRAMVAVHKLAGTSLGDVEAFVRIVLDREYLRGLRYGFWIAKEIAQGNFEGRMIFLPSGDKKELNVPKGRERIEK